MKKMKFGYFILACMYFRILVNAGQENYLDSKENPNFLYEKLKIASAN